MKKKRILSLAVLCFIIFNLLFTFVPGASYAGTQTVISVDAALNVHDINPLIYGMAFADKSIMDSLNIPINRCGGNSQTAYNWKTDSTNRGSDWYFESFPNDNSNPSALPNGSSTDIFYETNKAVNAETMLTVPMAGYVAKDREKRASFSVKKYGAQQETDQWFTDAGNGIKTDGSKITNNDPLDAYMAVNETFASDWVKHLTGRYGSANQGGVKYYILDNEPALWTETHRDFCKTILHDDELINLSIKYANTIKSADPSALVAGYEDWGWLSLHYSPYDSCFGDGITYPDMKKNGYNFFAEYYLRKMKEAETTYGKRLLDVFTTHLYPQSGESGSDESSNIQAKRMQSTRCFWDPNYVEANWQNERLYLIPRLKQWVNTNYPGTKIGITEYNWGSLEYPDGGIAQADILGIFGREGLDIGTLWTTVSPNTPGYNAFKIYRNYDGNKSTFGDKSIKCTVPNPDQISSFASLDSKTGEMKIIILSKYPSGDTPVTLNLANFNSIGSAAVYQWSGNGNIVQKPNINYTGSSVDLTVPAYSATMLVIGPKETATPTVTSTSTPSSLPSYRISGYLSPDFVPYDLVSGLKGGFSVSIPGTSISVTTDANGYFQLNNVPKSSNGVDIIISKEGYLTRTLKSIQVSNDLVIGSTSAPIEIWAGDLVIDGAINMTDVMEAAKAFNAVFEESPRYNPFIDMNRDRVINMADILIIAKHFNKAASDYPVYVASQTPTPAVIYSSTPTAAPQSVGL